jgi:hypothetical protein
LTAAELLTGAGEAGLVVTIKGKSLQIVGAPQARREWIPRLAPMAAEIAALIATGAAPAPSVKCSWNQPYPCPACGYIHGRLEPDPCSQCRAEDWVTSVVGRDGARICSRCLRAA